MASIEGELEEMIAASVDKSLDSMGRGFKSIFFWSLENRLGVKRNEIASKPEEFAMYLDRMFPSGAVQVKNEISDQLCRDLRIKRENEGLVELIKRVVHAEKAELPRS